MTALHSWMKAFPHKCAVFRVSADSLSQHLASPGYIHESGGTIPDMAQRLIQTVGRASTQRLATEIIYQQGCLRPCQFIVDRRSGIVEERVCFDEP